MGKKPSFELIKNIIIGVVFIGILIFLSIKFTPYILDVISNTEKFREYILSHGHIGAIVFLAFQFIQIVIPFIPGEIVQIAGGYIYGIVLGCTLLLIGGVLGTIISFYLARIVGYPVVKFFVSKEILDKFEFLLNSPKIEAVMFLLFLIPAMPKDALVYIAGLTPIKPIRFFIISMVARIPGLIISVFIGSNLLTKDYTSIIVITVVVSIIFSLGVVFRKKIINKLTFAPTAD